MRKLFSKLMIVGALGALTLFSGCGSDDAEILVVDPNAAFDVVLEFSDVSGNVTAPVDVISTQGIVKSRVVVTSTSKMFRLYITRNVGGAGDEPYTPADLTSKVTKPDGSIDVETNSTALDYALNLDVPSSITSGTVVYKFWATSGKGDYRDDSKRFVAGVGQIVLNYGGTNSASPVKAYKAKMLAAPLADGSSNTFISLLDGQLYKINQGAEYSALWDFGYYFGSTLKASLAAAGNYPTSIIDVATVAATTDAELNSCFFALSAKTTADFDAVSTSGDLSFIVSSANERINGLVAGDVVEFVDNYGKKGLIKVIQISGTNGTGDFIELDIKVQP